MSELLVKTGIMVDCASQEQQFARQLEAYMREVAAVRRSLGFKVKSRAQIDAQLKTVISVGEKNATRMKSLASALSDAATAYANTEKQVSDHPEDSRISIKPIGSVNINIPILGPGGQLNRDIIISAIGTGAVAAGSASNTKNDKKGLKFWDDIFPGVIKGIANLGIVGAAGSFIYDSFKSGGSFLKLGKAFSGLVGKGASVALKGSEAKWAEKMFGVGANFKTGGKIIADKIDDFKFGSGLAKNAKAAASWAGLLLSGAIESVENYKEFGGDLSNFRFWGETAIETATSVALPTLATAGVAAVAGALSLTPPGLVVTLVGTGAYVLSDLGCKAIFGKDIGECASDAVFFLGEKAVEGVKVAGKAVGNAVKSAGKAVGNAAKGVGKAVSGIGKAVASWI